MVPVVFSALAMNAVGKAAMEMVKEVRRQFKEIPGIMEYKAEPEYDKCVAISTQASLREMMLPGAMTIIFPLVVAFLPMAFGYNGQEAAEMLGGYMAGVAVSGVLWAIFQNNAGGAWDNAKKSFEAGVMIDGEMTYKGSEAHKAAVTGDTVGDPFKDTSGPSMNILIKLTCLVGLVIAPILGDGHGHEEVAEAAPVVTEVRQEVMKMKLKGQEFLAVGEGLKVAVSADLDVVVKNGAASLTMEVSSEELNGTFVSDEGASDGMLFDFNGVFTAADGTTSKGMVHFMKTEDGLTETFLEIVR
jgi:K(+)-stimulated pyrophosphate-energized sodium pump